jgi:pyruvoyl-dependent arginine decarboxylase (PvlArgDC)
MNADERTIRFDALYMRLKNVITCELKELRRLGVPPGEVLATIMTAATMVTGHAIATCALAMGGDDADERNALIEDYAEGICEDATKGAISFCAANEEAAQLLMNTASIQ